MLFPASDWAGLADGSITVAFRRWRRATVRAGGRLTTPAGVLAIDALEPIDPDAITEEDARRAGRASRAQVLEELSARPDGGVFRVAFHRAGPDPRIDLRQRAELDDADLAQLRARIERLDAASREGPWTAAVLAAIAERPATRAADLAAALGYERAPFKANVRKLKALGLTESLEVGYRLSPRGEAFRRAARSEAPSSP